MPPPLPPKVKEGRITVGKPISDCTARASSMLCAIRARAVSRPMSVMARRNSSRSSAMSIARCDAPIISTLNFSKTPSRTRSNAVLSAV